MIYKIVGFDIRNFAFIWGVFLIGFSLGKVFKIFENKQIPSMQHSLTRLEVSRWASLTNPCPRICIRPIKGKLKIKFGSSFKVIKLV